MSEKWTHDEVQSAFELYRSGYTNRQIGEKLGRTGNAVQGMFQREYGLGGNTIKRRFTAGSLLSRPPLLPSTTDYMVRAEATTAFLISLLRAGHTPGQGEFTITSEARVVPHCYLVGA